MQLLPAKLRRQLPALNAQTRIVTEEKMVYAKFYFPQADWTWFVVEGETEGDDFRFFGYVIGFLAHWKSFTLSELMQIRTSGLLRVERDTHFKGGKFKDVISQFRRSRGY